MNRSRVLGAALVLALLTGCAGPRGGFGDRLPNESVDVCAAVLPLALESVGGHGRLVAIHPLRPGQGAVILRELGITASPRPGEPAQSRTPNGSGTPSASTQTRGCAVAYRGSYDAATLPGASGKKGRYVVVLLRVRHPEVRMIVVTDTLPKGVQD